MTMYKLENGSKIKLTSEEETEVKAFQKAWTDEAPNRRMKKLRQQRDALLVETDWMANSDVTMSDAWTTYRQALRSYGRSG